MKFANVALASIGHFVPGTEITSAWLEMQLAEVYSRLKLPEGRLEGMSGIRTRRVWNRGTRLSDCSIESCRNALNAIGMDPKQVGCLIHASVCREFLEPATACRVHHHVGVSEDAWVYDVSNACLGIMNGAVQVAQLIESGAIRAGLVVGTEDSRGLMQATLDQLNGDESLTRQSIKPAFASLTIGSGSCAWLLVDRDWWSAQSTHGGSPVLAAVATARTQHHGLCQSDTDQAGLSMTPTMNTDSELLLGAGVETGVATFQKLLAELGWEREDLAATICHQVGAAHRRRMLDALGLPHVRDFATFERLGNTGSVALPTALALAIEEGAMPSAGRAALLGIGSGVNSLMIGLDLRPIQVRSSTQPSQSSSFSADQHFTA